MPLRSGLRDRLCQLRRIDVADIRQFATIAVRLDRGDVILGDRPQPTSAKRILRPVTCLYMGRLGFWEPHTLRTASNATARL